uniref:Uncharacterized protein n=1 Tax=Monodon monoceros TaxID=40151 RepID=A0A8C6BJD4_MONMO
MLKRRHFQMYYVNGEKKHSIVGTPILANVLCNVFSFIVYIGAFKTQGQILTKEVFSHTEYC